MDACVPLSKRYCNDALSKEGEEQAEVSARVVVGEAHTVPWVAIVPQQVEHNAVRLVVERVLSQESEMSMQLNQWNPHSQISRFNRGEIITPVGPLLKKALELAVKLYVATQGRFDPSLCAQRDLWLSCLAQGSVPSAVSMMKIREETKPFPDTFVVEGHELRPLRNVPLDLNAISKGIAVDCVAELLGPLCRGSFFFDWGGETCVGGAHPSGRPWRMAVLKPPSLRRVYQAWLAQSKPYIDPTQYQGTLNLQGALFVSTSGDWAQPLKHGYFPLCARNGMLLQASSSSVAVATIVSSHGAAVADALATSAMLFDSLEEAQRFLLSVKDSFGVQEFHLLSRIAHVTDKSPHPPPEDRLLPQGTLAPPCFRISNDFLALLNSTVVEKSTMVDIESIRCNTLRVASVSPALCSILLSDPTVQVKSFHLGPHFCSVLHQSGALVIASISMLDESGGAGTKVRQLRKKYDTPFVVSVLLVKSGASMKCSSLAWTETLLSFNAELGGAMGSSLMDDAQSGDEIQFVFETFQKKLICEIRDTASCGDHVVCITGVREEIAI